MTIERTYSARRVAAGLYIQPSNDGKRRYVIAKREDGTDYGLESGPARFTFWSFAEVTDDKLRAVEATAGHDHVAALQMLVDVTDLWGVKTKAEAIASVLADDAENHPTNEEN